MVKTFIRTWTPNPTINGTVYCFIIMGKFYSYIKLNVLGILAFLMGGLIFTEDQKIDNIKMRYDIGSNPHK